MSIPSLLRLAEHTALSSVTLSGRVLDLGGEKGSDYLNCFKGHFEVTTVNMDGKVPDIVHDLEKPLPVADSSYDHVLLINVLEHIFAYQQLLRESMRMLKPGGTAVIVVPFLFPVHPSPQDYRRFTASALQKELSEIGYRDISVEALGGGVFTTCYLFIDRLLPFSLRFLAFYTDRYILRALDALWIFLARVLHKKYRKEDYAIGYCVVARK
jgi:SAM-dependent methyltransferase